MGVLLYDFPIMGMKQNIIIRNQYTIKGANGKGSRGSTPGAYVLRYMARDNAVEPIAPVRTTAQAVLIQDGGLQAGSGEDVADFITRYMARDSAVESLNEGVTYTPKMSKRKPVEDEQVDAYENTPYVPVVHTANNALKTAFYQQRRLSGMAFGNDDVALSDKDLRERAKEIQRLFDHGKTVMKTVVSFDHKYLQDMGVVSKDLQVRSDGDYRGKVDQLKLRLALMRGVERMGRMYYDDLRYVGVIQVDTQHVHCHFAIVDRGVGTIMPDGTQRGKITEVQRQQLRRGINDSLQSQAELHQMVSAVDYEKRNVASHIRKWAYNAFEQESAAQFILACLPDDTRMWRAGSHAKVMQKPNAIVRQLVEERFADEDSGFSLAMARVEEYADERVSREGLSDTARDNIVAVGRNRIVERAMNGVYKVLAQVPQGQKDVSTEFMRSMSGDLNTTRHKAFSSSEKESGPADSVGLDEFIVRLRSYHARLDYHTVRVDHFSKRIGEFNQAADAGEVHDDAYVMLDFYRTEHQYHSRAQAKYQHYFKSQIDRRDISVTWADVSAYGARVIAMRALRDDASIASISDFDVAEDVGLSVYGERGGGYVAAKGVDKASGRAIVDDRVSRMESRYVQMVGQMRDTLLRRGMDLVIDTDDNEVDNEGFEMKLPPFGKTRPKKAVEEATRKIRQEVADAGLSAGEVDVYTPGVPLMVRMEPAFSFEMVKGVDLHDVAYDISEDTRVGKRNALRFRQLAQKRKMDVDAARKWMEETSQAADVDAELGESARDVERMLYTSYGLDQSLVLPARTTGFENDMGQVGLGDREEGGDDVEYIDGEVDDYAAVASGSTYRLHYRVSDQIDRQIEREIARQMQLDASDELGDAN